MLSTLWCGLLSRRAAGHSIPFNAGAIVAASGIQGKTARENTGILSERMVLSIF